jgi:hypothetical protein
MGIVNARRPTALLVAAGLAIATPAGAQFGNRSGADAYRTEGLARAADAGYRDGFERGHEDRRDRRSFNYTDERSYRNGDRGYEREFGDREAYRRAFRAAYVDGYGDGYYGRGALGDAGRWSGSPGNRRAIPRGGAYGTNRYPGYPSQGRYPGYPTQGRYPGYRIGIQTARGYGFEDGYTRGLDDGRDGEGFDPTRHGWYRSATRGYRGQYGAKDFYRNEYRLAFRQGYERGYREARVTRSGRLRRW